MKVLPRWPGGSRVLLALLMAGMVSCSREHGDLLVAVPPTPDAFPVWDPEGFAAARGVDLADLWMHPDGNEGWVVGDQGVILHLQSRKWHADTVENLPQGAWTSVAFDASATRGFAVGADGWVAAYAGGHRWRARQEAPEAQVLTSVWVDAAGREAFAVGRGGVALRWQAGRWARLPLAHDSGRGILLDVAANDRELWVRDSALVAVYSRPDYRWLRDLTRYRASRLWTQPSSPAVWIGGVTQPGHPDVRFSVLAVRPERTDTLSRIRVMPRAAWMGDTLGCGMVAGLDERPGGAMGSFWIYSVGTRLHPFMFENPDSAQVRAVWVNADCSAGWAVGSRGYVARLHRQPLRVDQVKQDGGSVETLTGRYSLHLSPGVPVPTIDSLQLLRDRGVIRLEKGKHFVMDSAGGSPAAVRVTEAGRTETAAFKNARVRLRFFVSYPVSTPRYPVVYERDAAFHLGGGRFWERNRKWLLWGAPLCTYLVFLGLIPISRRVRRIAFDREGPAASLKGVFGLFPGYLLKVWPWWRRLTFRRYQTAFREEFPPHDGEPATVESVHCPDLRPAIWQTPTATRWRHVFEDLLHARNPVLWVEDALGGPGRDLLRRWGRVAWEHRLIPVYLDLRDPSSLEDQIRREWARLGDISGGIPKLWESGGFLFLLDDSHGQHDPAALDRFLRDERGRNVLVVQRPGRPTLDFGCHLRVVP